MLTLRSIYPDISLDSNAINYERFSEELKLWRYYRRGGNRALNELVLRDNKTDLFEESSLIRAIPIFLSNQNMDSAVKIAFENTLYFTENIDAIFSSISFGVLLSNKINGLNLSESFELLKESIISLRTVEYLKDSYKKDDNIYIIRIESKKIELIQTIDRFLSKHFDIQSEIAIVTKAELQAQQPESGDESGIENDDIIKLDKEKDSKIILDFLEKVSKQDIADIISPFLENGIDVENNYLRNIGSYIYRLRKGRVPADSLKFIKTEDISVFSLREGEHFENSVLGDSTLEKISLENGFELRYVRSKSGKYRFFRKI